MEDNPPANTQEFPVLIPIESQPVVNIKDIFTSDYWTKSEYGHLSRLYLLFKHLEMLGLVDNKGNFL